MATPKNKNNLKYAIITIVFVIVIFIIIIIVKSPTTANLNAGDQVASSSIVNNISSIKTDLLGSIGLGTSIAYPKPIKGQTVTKNGKPEILYEGAEYCPYCATERWAVAVALDRFGSFSGLELTHSSSTDVYPDTQSLSFYGSSYTSPYIDFTPVEMYSNVPQGQGYATLMPQNSQEQQLMSTYDSPPYVSSSNSGAIPFIYFGGKYIISGATYSPTVIQGKTATQIASALSNPSSPIAKGADGAANAIIAAICSLTKNQPSSVCTTQIQNIEQTLSHQ